MHRSRILLAGDCGQVSGIPVTSATRTLIDLSSQYEKPRLRPMLEHGLVNGLFLASELRGRLEALGPGRRGAGAVGELLDGYPACGRPMGSHFEARLFEDFRAAGLPLPVAQFKVVLPGGRVVFLDFAYPDAKLALEADSFIWHATREAWRRDRARNNELIADGWSILPITWDLIVRHPGQLGRQVAAALLSRGVSTGMYPVGLVVPSPRGA